MHEQFPFEVTEEVHPTPSRLHAFYRVPAAKIFSRRKPGQCPLWVISGHFAMRERCPLYPQQQTFRASACQLCAKSDIALPQSITSSARAARGAHNSEKRKIGLRCSAIGRHAAMGQLLVTLIIPPIVGLVTYIVVRHIWERDENGVYALNQSGGTVVFGDGIQGAVPPRDQSNVEASYKVGDGMEAVTCHCGAIYETIETTGPIKDQSPFKCVLCEKELSTRTSVQFRLRQQPEQDRA
jgi:hypothetical protein